jgi:hypothetical protein
VSAFCSSSSLNMFGGIFQREWSRHDGVVLLARWLSRIAMWFSYLNWRLNSLSYLRSGIFVGLGMLGS